jgi:hypothetical protein
VEVHFRNSHGARIFGEAEDGVTWGGNVGPVGLERESFFRCRGIDSSASFEVVGMPLGDIGDADRIIVNFS